MNHWTKKDFFAYVLMYCAHADFIESGIELDVIKEKVSRERLDEIFQLFETENDYQHIQTINQQLENLNISKDDINALLMEMKTLFFADGDYSQLEQNLMIGLKKILK